MRTPMTAICLGLATLTAIACGSGTTSTAGSATHAPKTSAGPSQIATAPVGTPITINSSPLGSQSQVIITVKSTKISTTGANEVDTPKGEYLIADISIECQQGTYHANPLNFYVVATDGVRTDGQGTSFTPALESVDLQAGQKDAGLVVFDITPGSEKGAKITVQELLGGTDDAYWTL